MTLLKRVSIWNRTMTTKLNNGKRIRGFGADSKVTAICHSFSKDEAVELCNSLLEWYDTNKRDLPWRRMDTADDPNVRGYAVWVSEIMLQQTQVATVIDYYNRWMKKWPTLHALARADLEEVNEMWSGLGYYSRGRRLHEGACKVANDLNGVMPQTSENLEKKLPGVGRYTAGAIASIAFNQQAALVDGNVIRVLSRLRIIGSDTNNPKTIDSLWSIANSIVPERRPGDFNQSLMELGATVCTPKNPVCSQCPVSKLCKARTQVLLQKKENAEKLGQNEATCENGLLDIECLVDDCMLCLPPDVPYDQSLGVTNYPRKGKKKAPRDERTAVCVVKRNSEAGPEYLIVQRPKTGLLAGLWEFPSLLVDLSTSENSCEGTMLEKITSELSLEEESIEMHAIVGEVVHIFSHIHQTYVVSSMTLASRAQCDINSLSQPAQWVTKDQLLESAISTAMKKVFKKFDSLNDLHASKSNKKRLSKSSNQDGKKQTSLNAFFRQK